MRRRNAGEGNQWKNRETEGADKLGNRPRLMKKMQCRCGGKANWGRAGEARNTLEKRQKPPENTQNTQNTDRTLLGTKMKKYFILLFSHLLVFQKKAVPLL